MIRPSLPWWALTALAVALAIAFVGLGRWQWQRGDARQEEWDAFARGADAARPLGASKLDDVARFARLSVTGRLQPERQFLLDNRSHAGVPGYEVLTPLELADGRTLLVDRGWVAFTGSRAHLPTVSFAPAPLVTVVGRVDNLPSAGLAYGRAPPALEGSWPRVTSYPRMSELSAALNRALEARILLLDPSAADGYVRDWQPPGIPPARHWAYAIQWWLFAATLVVLWSVASVRRARRTR
jgi:cytochrome oxidase assembly protein ShyY1